MLERVHPRSRTAIFAAAISAISLSSAAYEVTLPSSEWKRLDSFEAHTLAKADQAFHKKLYRDALANYDAFILEFPRSKAVPYALLRKGRCRHLDEKRFQAIELYEELLDYFPNLVPYAAPALFYIGSSHAENGDLEKAMKAWLEMATDEDYRRHTLAAHAIFSLADNLARQKKESDAVKYFEQVAVDFRNKNPDPARQAMSRAITHYVRLAPNEKRLQELYRKVRSFEHNPRTIPEDAEISFDKLYWQRVWERVWHEARAFSTAQKDDRKRYFRYWAKVFDGKFADWEEFQMHAANITLQASGDTERWIKRMDELFAKGYKDGDIGRICRWMSVYRAHPTKIKEYLDKIELKKLKLNGIRDLVGLLAGLGQKGMAKSVFDKMYKTFDFETLSNKDIETLAFIIFSSLQDGPMGQNMVRKIRVYQLSDDEKEGLSGRLQRVDGPGVRWVCLQFDEKDRGKNVLVNYYYRLGPGGVRRGGGPAGQTLDAKQVKKERMDLAAHLTGVDDYAAGAWWIKAEFHFWERQLKEALAGYRMADNPPDNLWQIVECFKGMGNVESAVGQLIEIENFFKSQAPRAALAIAYTYRWARRKNEEISAFRAVLKKYPESGESSRAHQELEKMGIKMGGGTDAK